MIEMPTMVMIGAAARNAGKTEFACGVIRKFADEYDITAVKVTTVAEKNGLCPRGGQGCGVCSSMEGEFAVMEETSTTSDKDTARLLGAGAKKVYWLRVMKESLQEGAKALLNIIGQKSICVCESNSLRQVIRPGLFVVVKDKKSDYYKPSSLSVVEFADRIVNFDGSGFDLRPEAICFVDGKWHLAESEGALE